MKENMFWVLTSAYVKVKLEELLSHGLVGIFKIQFVQTLLPINKEMLTELSHKIEYNFVKNK